MKKEREREGGGAWPDMVERAGERENRGEGE